eukprot:901075_1
MSCAKIVILTNALACLIYGIIGVYHPTDVSDQGKVYVQLMGAFQLLLTAMFISVVFGGTDKLRQVVLLCSAFFYCHIIGIVLYNSHELTQKAVIKSITIYAIFTILNVVVAVMPFMPCNHLFYWTWMNQQLQRPFIILGLEQDKTSCTVSVQTCNNEPQMEPDEQSKVSVVEIKPHVDLHKKDTTVVQNNVKERQELDSIQEHGPHLDSPKKRTINLHYNWAKMVGRRRESYVDPLLPKIKDNKDSDVIIKTHALSD